LDTVEKLKSLVGIKSEEQKALEKQEHFQEKQLEIASRRSPVEAAQSMALMKNAGSDGQYELGALALDPDADIEEFKSQLRGYRYVPIERDGKIVYQKDVFGKPAMNEDGINYIVNTVRFYASKTFSLTNYSSGKDKTDEGKRMIARRCKIAAIKIASALTMYRVQWEIDPIKRPLIADMSQNFIEACFNRSLDNRTAAHYWGSQKSIQHTTQQINEAPVKKSLFGSG
jgi:hypothetical protein